MKNLARFASFVCVAFIASAALAANPSVLDVIVRADPGGSVVYQGKADARGSFATATLPKGNYIVEFRSKNSAAVKGRQFALAITGGKNRVTANSVPGEKFAGGGVAMKVEIAKAGQLSGQVANAQTVAAGTGGMGKVRGNVKVMNGKRYVWVPGAIGSKMGGKWVEEGTEGAAISTSNRRGGDTEVLRHFQDQSGNVGQRGKRLDANSSGG